jgi:hypothetical protein
LPLNSAPEFQTLFQNLEMSLDALGLDNVSISMTTLEEGLFLIFSKIS